MQEMSEQELAQVSGAERGGLPVSKVCPKCSSDQYSLIGDGNVRKCKVCGTNYTRRAYGGAFEPGR